MSGWQAGAPASPVTSRGAIHAIFCRAQAVSLWFLWSPRPAGITMRLAWIDRLTAAEQHESEEQAGDEVRSSNTR